MRILLLTILTLTIFSCSTEDECHTCLVRTNSSMQNAIDHCQGDPNTYPDFDIMEIDTFTICDEMEVMEILDSQYEDQTVMCSSAVGYYQRTVHCFK